MREFLNEFVSNCHNINCYGYSTILWDGLRSDNGVIVPAVVRGLICFRHYI